MSESNSDHQNQIDAMPNLTDVKDKSEGETSVPTLSSLSESLLASPSASTSIIAATLPLVTQSKSHESQNSPRTNPNPQLFKLNTDCFDEIFEWLSQEDLDALGQTCKVMQLVTGDYFQRTFPALPAIVGDDGLYVNNSIRTLSSRTPCKLHSFDKFMKKISISENAQSVGDGVGMFCYVGSNCMKSIKHIQFRNVYLGQMELEWIGKILENIETITFEDCVIQKPFYKKFPKLCGNLRSLNVKDCRWITTDANGIDWLHYKYAKLEHFGWIQRDIIELKSLVQLNPKIRSFSTSFSSCVQSYTGLRKGDLNEIDDLYIELDDWNRDLFYQDIYNQLNVIYELGGYKRLHIITSYFDNGLFEKMSLLQGLYSLSLHEINDRYTLPKLEQLKELNIRYINLDINTEMIKQNEYINSKLFKNIERVYFKFTKFIHLIPFLYFAPTLRAVKMGIILDRQNFSSCIDLREIDSRRKNLKNARKVTIYVDDNVYIPTKWINPKIEFKYVEMKRANAQEWNNLIEFD